MKIFNYLFYIILCAGLAACVEQETTVQEDDQLKATAQSRGQLSKPSAEEFKQAYLQRINKYLNERKQSFSAEAYIHRYAYPNPWDPCIYCYYAEDDRDGISDGVDSFPLSNSETNLIEQGVNEADRVKTNGQFIYTAHDSMLSIYQHLGQGASASLQSSIDFNSIENFDSAADQASSTANDGMTQPNSELIGNLPENYLQNGMSLNSLYLNNENITVNATKRTVLPTDNQIDLYRWYGEYYKYTAKIYQLNTQDKNSPTIVNQGVFPAQISQTREVNNTLIYTFNYQTSIDLSEINSALDATLDAVEDLEKIIESPELLAQQAQIISAQYALEIEKLKVKLAQQGIDQYLAQYKLNDQNIDLASCYANAKLSEDASGLPVLQYVVGLDADSLGLKYSACIVRDDGYRYSNIDFYMSPTSLYLFMPFSVESQNSSPENNKQYDHAMRIERFSLTQDAIDYKGFGEVFGRFPSNGNRNFYMSEYQNHLRLFTDMGDWREPENSLHILKLNNSALNAVAQLPNKSEPASIGKPGEVAYGARFAGSQAYLITGEREFSSDPLIRFDLNIPQKPRIIGELDVLSFASYLHVIDDNLLLGVGQNAGAVDVRLFDISEPTPKLLDSIAIDNARQQLGNEHHGICTLNNGSSQKLGFIVTPNWQNGVQPSPYWLSLELDRDAAKPQLNVSPQQLTLSERYANNPRCFMIEDTFYSLNANALSQMQW